MSWREYDLDSLCRQVTSGGTPSTSRPEYYGGAIPWLRTQEVHFNRILDTELTITEDGLANSAAKWIPENSIIVAMYGNSAGRVATNQIPLTTNQACCNLTPNETKADYRFIYYRLLLDYDVLHQMAKGAAQNNLNAGQIRSYRIRAPHVLEQARIADILSAYDGLIENNRRRMALLEEAARQLYREWFIRLRFPGHEHTRITNGVPEGWERLPLGDRVTLNYGKALKAEDRTKGPCPVYGSSGIVGTHEKSLAAAPGIVVGRKGNIGSVYWCPKDYWPIDTVYFIDAEASNLWLYYSLQHMHFISTDVAVPGLNRDFAYSRSLLVPEPRIVRDFLEAAVPLHDQITKLDEMNDRLRAARDLLLPRLMCGEIAV
jgi:type I restriction enzyme S subunit